MADEKTIYVVTSGEYSAYGIDAVFDDAEMAEEYRAKFHCGRVEEFPLNPLVALVREGYQAWCVEMRRDGTVISATITNHAPSGDGYLPYQCAYMVAQMMAKDERHAIKIANEWRAQKIANGEWKD